MKSTLLALLFLLGAAPSIQAENNSLIQKESEVDRKSSKSSSLAVVDVAITKNADSIRYLGKKVYVRRERKATDGSVDDDCYFEGGDSSSVQKISRLGYVWSERFCLEGSFQYQQEGGANYSVQAVIRF